MRNLPALFSPAVFLAVALLALMGGEAYSYDRDPVRTGTWYWGSSSLPLREARAVAARGPFAYVAYGPDGLVVLDVSGPSPFLLTRYPASNTTINVKVFGDYAFVIDFFSGVQICTLKNGGYPDLVANYDPGDAVRDVAVCDQRMYVVDGQAGLSIVSITNPAAPVLLGRVANFDARAVVVVGHLAYVANGNGLKIVNVIDPAAPAPLGNVGVSSAEDVKVSGRYAYLAANGVHVIDVIDPVSPRLVATLSTPSSPISLAVSNSFIFVADYEGGVILVDASDPIHPRRIGGFHTPGTASGVALSDKRVLVADGWAGLQVLETEKVANPQRVGQAVTSHFATAVAVAGHHAYVADAIDGLQVFDIRDPTEPRRVGRSPAGGYAQGIAVSGELCFLTANPGGVQIFNVRDPASPQRITNYVTDAALGVSAVSNLLFVASSARGLEIVDVRVPTQPRLLKRVTTGGPAKAVTVSGSYAYVAVATNALEVIDVSQPEEARVVGRYALGGYSDLLRSISYDGRSVLLGLSDQNVKFMDVSDPTHPFPHATVSTRGQPLGAVVSGPYLNIASEHGGLEVFDATGSWTLRRVGGNTGFVAKAVDAAGDQLFVAAGQDGLVVLNRFTPWNGPPIALRALPPTNGQNFGFGLSGVPGLTVQIERSTNFLVWQPWLSVRTTNAESLIFEPRPSQFRYEFYRALAP